MTGPGGRRGCTMTGMNPSPDPDWYFEHVLRYAEPGVARLQLPGPAQQWAAWWAAQAADDSPTGASARSQGFVLTAAQLRRCQVSRQHARTLVRRGRWSAPARGVVAPVDVRDDDEHVVRRRRHALCAAAAARQHADHVVSGRSAAILHGLPTFAVPDLPELTDAEPTGPGRRAAAHVFSASLAAGDVTRWFGVPVTTVARTLVDLARHDRWDAVMAVDAALAERLTAPVDIETALDQAVGWPGVRQARSVLAHADGRAESPLESLTRLRLLDDGFPAPDLQVRLGEHRVDLLLREWNLVIEVDGLGKYSDEEMRREKRREMRLRAMGYRVERVTWDDVVHHWPETRTRLLLSAARLPA
jgi:very-short-patch-repair endonuclease